MIVYQQHPYGSQSISELGADEIKPSVFDIEGRAAAGAKKALKPLLTSSMVISVAGLLLGGAALVVAIRR